MNLEFKSECTEVHGVILKGVAIGKIITDIEVIQSGALGNCFELHFKCGYSIKIDSRGLSLQRTISRPDHDHDHIQHLCVDKEKKTLSWDKDYIYEGGREIARIPFGPVAEGQIKPDKFY